VQITRLETRSFRNLDSQELSPHPGVTLVIGPNGAGKSNLLEAITVLGNLTSFRPGPPTAYFRWHAESYLLAATVVRDGTPVEIRQEARLGRHIARTLFRGGRRLTMGEYLQLCPVAALSGFDRALVTGTPEDRRRFLDRLAFHLHPEALRMLQQYRRALRQRAGLLLGGGQFEELEAFEQILAATGARLVELRLATLRRLVSGLEGEMGLLQWAAGRPQVRYHAPDGLGSPDASQLAVRLGSALARSRRLDAQQRRTTVGPHRHDLAITVGGVPAREALSAGQAKLLAVGLRLAALAVLEERLGGAPVVVFDDVDAELDASALGRVLARLHGRAQVLISSARPELVLPAAAAVRVWRVEEGRVVVADDERSVE
jgi:DNA replication and repair protein RecF